MYEFIVSVSVTAKSEDHQRELFEEFKRMVGEIRIEKTGNHLFVELVDEA